MKLQVPQITLALLLVLDGGIANAVPVPILDVPALAAESDLIVVGNVKSIRDGGATSVSISGGGSVPARLVLCEIEVDSVQKGTIDGRRISFRYVLPGEPIGYASVVEGYQMLFLKKVNSEYALASPYHAALPAVPGTGDGGGDYLARIAVHLGAVLQSPAASLGQKQIVLYALSTIRTPESTGLLREGLEQRDAALRLGAAGFLLLRDDLSGMETAEYALTHTDNLSRNTLHNLDYAIGEGVKSKDAVPALSRLAQVQDLETRRAAASALRHTGSKSALGPLAYLLDDSDLQVRHDAVMGLAEITGDLEWAPNLDLFQSEEQRYLKHWHDWASANGLSR